MTPSRSLFLLVPASWLLFTLILLTSGCGGGANASPQSTAQSAASSFAITVTAPPPSAGTVTSNPPGITCPSTCFAMFPQNTRVKLTATPRHHFFFEGWSGDCSGTGTCNLTITSSSTVTADFAAANSGGSAPGSNVIAYVFTPDSVLLNSPEVALLANGELQTTKYFAHTWLMAPTAHGLVMSAPLADWFTANPNLQSYVVKANGSLKPQGSLLSISMNNFISLAGDSNFAYAVTDDGIFGFQDKITGLTGLPPVQSPAFPSRCTPAQQKANPNECQYGAWLTLGVSTAFLLESEYAGFGTPLYQLSVFNRSQGQLTAVGAPLYWTYSIAAPTPDGRFVYGFDALQSNRIFRLTVGGNGTLDWSVLSNGRQLLDEFAQLLISADGSFLFAVVSGASESSRVRVFRIDQSNGDFTEVPGSPFLTGENYFTSAALDPTGHFLLAAHAYCDGSPPCIGPAKLVAMSIDSTTGALAITSDVEDGQDPIAVYAVPISQ